MMARAALHNASEHWIRISDEPHGDQMVGASKVSVNGGEFSGAHGQSGGNMRCIIRTKIARRHEIRCGVKDDSAQPILGDVGELTHEIIKLLPSIGWNHRSRTIGCRSHR